MWNRFLIWLGIRAEPTSPDFIIIDEASDIDPEAFENIKPLLPKKQKSRSRKK